MLEMSGTFAYNVGDMRLDRVTVLGLSGEPSGVSINSVEVRAEDVSFDGASRVVVVSCDLPLTQGVTISLGSGYRT